MKHDISDWKIDASAKQAMHISGLLLRAERHGEQWQVQPVMETLPPHGPPMPEPAAAAARAWIGHLVAAGGDLLVKAIVRHQSTH